MSKFWTSKKQFWSLLILLLSLSLVLPSSRASAVDAAACAVAFDPAFPISPVRALTPVIESRALIRTSEDLKTQLMKLQTGLKETERATYSTLAGKIEGLGERLDNPYSIEHSINAEAKAGGRTGYDDAFELVSILVHDSDPIAKARALDQWTKSEAHALLAYDYLYTVGLVKEQPTYEWLLKNSLFYIDAQPVRGPPGALVTFSFEKEGSQPEISKLYKDPSVSDEEWLKRDATTRVSDLGKLTVRKKSFLAATQIAPTAFKPEYLGGYSQELSTPQMPGYSWEISNKRYEFSLPRLLNEVGEISNLFKETHSFHLHVVFELPKKYPYFAQFADWVKHVNDYLYLRGMEEGLHGNYLTDIAEKPATGFFSKLVDAFQSSQSSFVKTIPHKASMISNQSHKFFSMGVRSGLYGDARDESNQKLGLELRDTTRKLDSLKLYAEHVSQSVSTFAWEKAVRVSGIDKQIALSKNPEKSKSLVSKLVGPEFAERLYQAEPTVAVGLIEFENGHYFNYQTGNFDALSPGVELRLRNARAVYVKSLVNLKSEIERMEKDGEKVETTDVNVAIKMSLSEWAGLAKASEIYSHF